MLQKMYCQKTLQISFQKVTFTQGILFTSTAARFINLSRAVFCSATNYNKMHGKQSRKQTITAISAALMITHTFFKWLLQSMIGYYSVVQLFLEEPPKVFIGKAVSHLSHSLSQKSNCTIFGSLQCVISLQSLSGDLYFDPFNHFICILDRRSQADSWGVVLLIL